MTISNKFWRIYDTKAVWLYKMGFHDTLINLLKFSEDDMNELNYQITGMLTIRFSYDTDPDNSFIRWIDIE
jgi:hypothetical protein